MAGPSRDDDELERLQRDLWEARHGHGGPGEHDFTPYPSLIARADALGDRRTMFTARLDAAMAAASWGPSVDQLTLVAWMLADLDARGPELRLHEYEMFEVYVNLADVVMNAIELPAMGFDQIRALVADWTVRATAGGYDPSAVEAYVEAEIALHQGDPGRAVEIMEPMLGTPPPPGFCDDWIEACLTRYYAEAGRDHDAVSLGEGGLADNGNRCGFFPAEPSYPLVGPYARAGRRDDVVTAVRAVDRVWRHPAMIGRAAESLIGLLHVDELATAHQLVLRHLDRIDEAFSPMTELQQATAIGAVFASVAAIDPDSVVAQRISPSQPARVRPVGELADEFATRARELAQRFDIRNRTTAISDRTERLLAVRGGGYPESEVVPVARRDAAGLLSGMFVFRPVSERRAEQCAELLRDKLSDLTELERVRAEQALAWDRRRTDPDLSVAELRTAAERASAIGRPHWAMQSRLLADALEVDLSAGSSLPAADAVPDPGWEPERQANIWNIRAMLISGTDTSAAIATLDRGLAVLADPDAAVRLREGAGSPVADSWMLKATMHRARANLRGSQDLEFADDADAAVSAARRAVASATGSDQRMEARAELVEALRLASADQQQRDPAGVEPLLDEALTHSRYVQRAEVLMHRYEIRLAAGDLGGAVDDAEHARAVLTVEGLAHTADSVALDLAGVMVERGDDAQSVIDIVGPVTDRMTALGDDYHADRGRRVMATAQSRAGLHAEAAMTVTAVLETLPPDSPEDDRARLLRFRADERDAVDDAPAAIVDYLAAADVFEAIGAVVDAVDALRRAAMASHTLHDVAVAEAHLARAGRLLAVLPDGPETVYTRAQVDIAAADLRAAEDPDGARVLLAAALEAARHNGWIPLVVAACASAAWVEYQQDDRQAADARIAEGLSYAPDDSTLLDMRTFIGELPD
ncbi:hypothetical protein [Gordonia sp. NB41Y]|uniref:hypothetical protein n=1 Tax=Gordonia sp. NB41Y TaxID=875808 RepID=UPI00128F6E99|nr:hypothetical protein [Gordonia sp. NB41Y]WLP88858.1 hypothetical protein Q9K23_14715 [Gordonia sp. NB41Y]